MNCNLTTIDLLGKIVLSLFFFAGTQPTSFSHCLSTNQNVESVSTETTNSESAYSDQTDSGENQVESITVSKTPPWRKNSILNQQQQQQQHQTAIITQNNVDNTDTNSRVPPLPHQQQLVQTQPPWQEETQKRRNNSKRRPNFKEDPTGYLGKLSHNLTDRIKIRKRKNI